MWKLFLPTDFQGHLGFALSALGNQTMQPKHQFKQWREKTTLINHIDIEHLAKLNQERPILCPAPSPFPSLVVYVDDMDWMATQSRPSTRWTPSYVDFANGFEEWRERLGYRLR